MPFRGDYYEQPLPLPPWMREQNASSYISDERIRRSIEDGDADMRFINRTACALIGTFVALITEPFVSLEGMKNFAIRKATEAATSASDALVSSVHQGSDFVSLAIQTAAHDVKNSALKKISENSNEIATAAVAVGAVALTGAALCWSKNCVCRGLKNKSIREVGKGLLGGISAASSLFIGVLALR
jgi:hypothetical protein